MGREAVFTDYVGPGTSGTHWDVSVHIDDSQDVDGASEWGFSETDIVATGFSRDYRGWRRATPPRQADIREDWVVLRLTTDLQPGEQIATLVERVTAVFAGIVGDGHAWIAVDRRLCPEHEAELLVWLGAGDRALAVFEEIVQLCNWGWAGLDDDGWRRAILWEPAADEHGDPLIDEHIVWAEMSAEPWSSPARRRTTAA
ncbi:MAG: hypothetical protein ABSG64_00285 [Solirubrobacteraceae bacterium]